VYKYIRTCASAVVHGVRIYSYLELQRDNSCSGSFAKKIHTNVSITTSIIPENFRQIERFELCNFLSYVFWAKHFFKQVRCKRLLLGAITCCVPHNKFFHTGSFATKIFTNVLYNYRHQPWKLQANRARSFQVRQYFINCPLLGASYNILGARFRHYVQTSKVES